METDNGSIFLALEFLAVFFVSFIALFIDFFIVNTSRQLKPHKKEIRKAVNITLFIFLVAIVVILNVVAFFKAPAYLLGDYSILNWPKKYIEISGYDFFDFSWPFSVLQVTNTIIALLATFLLAIIIPIILFFSRKSKNKDIIVKVIKGVIATVLVIDLVIVAVWVYINLLPDARTIFIVVLIALTIIIPLLFITAWRPLINRFTSTQNKTFNERMKDLTSEFSQVSKSADMILDQMKVEIENHEKEINDRRMQLDNLKRVEEEQRNRVATWEKTIPETEKEMEKMLDKRDRKGLTYSIIFLFIGAILGVVATALAHAINLWGL